MRYTLASEDLNHHVERLLQFGWFDEIAKRHGGASAEVAQAKLLVELSGQLYFDFPLHAA